MGFVDPPAQVFLFWRGGHKVLVTYRESFDETRRALKGTPSAAPGASYGRLRGTVILLAPHPEMRPLEISFLLPSFVHRLRARLGAPGHLAPAIGSY